MKLVSFLNLAFMVPDGKTSRRKSRLGGLRSKLLSKLLVGMMVLGTGTGNSFANGAVPTAPAAPGAQGRAESQGPAPGKTVPGAPVLPEAPVPGDVGLGAAAQAGLVSLNFTGADLVEVIHVLAQYLKLNYTIDPGVRGNVTLYSAQPLRQSDLLPVFHQVLRMNDAVAVKSGDFYHITSIKDGKGLVRPARRLGEHGYILQVVPVRFFSVTELRRLLEPFITPGGEIIDYPRGNFLIILDLATNIQRLMEIKDLIDVNVFAGVRMELYQPKAASAEELASEMEKIMQAYAASAPQAENFVARFVPVPRINRLLVISYSEAAWTYAKRWLDRIDTYAEGPGRRIFVYPVENGKAVDLADILNQVLGQGSAGASGSRKTLKDVAERIAGGGQSSTSGTSTSGTSGTGAAPSGSLYAVAQTQPQPAPTAPRPPVRSTTSEATPAPQEEVRIVPDPATNSLIIFGTVQEFRNIREILKDIDIVPRQVLMDVMIAEVTLSDDLRFGVEYQILRDDDVEIFGRDFNQHISVLSGLPLPSGGAGPAALSTVIGTGSEIRGFLNARREDSRVKVLSSPSILATDNQPARIQVGTEEPIATGTVTSPVSSGVTSSTTIQYRNTGRILTIIPQVNAQGLVNLQVKTEVSQRGASVTVGQDSFPAFDTRDAETTAVVQDGETLAIGGIITERVNRSRLGIPYLMDIPVFGRFFGTTTDDIDRTELIILITPHVIRNKDEARSVTEEFKAMLEGVVQEYRWEIRNLERQEKNRNAQPQPDAETSSHKEVPSTLQAPEAEASANKATIVLPAKPEAWEKLSLDAESLNNELATDRAVQEARQETPSVESEKTLMAARERIGESYPQVKQGSEPDVNPVAELKDSFTQELLTAVLDELEQRARKERAKTLDKNKQEELAKEELAGKAASEESDGPTTLSQAKQIGKDQKDNRDKSPDGMEESIPGTPAKTETSGRDHETAITAGDIAAGNPTAGKPVIAAKQPENSKGKSDQRHEKAGAAAPPDKMPNRNKAALPSEKNQKDMEVSTEASGNTSPAVEPSVKISPAGGTNDSLAMKLRSQPQARVTEGAQDKPLVPSKESEEASQLAKASAGGGLGNSSLETKETGPIIAALPKRAIVKTQSEAVLKERAAQATMSILNALERDADLEVELPVSEPVEPVDSEDQVLWEDDEVIPAALLETWARKNKQSVSAAKNQETVQPGHVGRSESITIATSDVITPLTQKAIEPPSPEKKPTRSSGDEAKDEPGENALKFNLQATKGPSVPPSIPAKSEKAPNDERTAPSGEKALDLKARAKKDPGVDSRERVGSATLVNGGIIELGQKGLLAGHIETKGIQKSIGDEDLTEETPASSLKPGETESANAMIAAMSPPAMTGFTSRSNPQLSVTNRAVPGDSGTVSSPGDWSSVEGVRFEKGKPGPSTAGAEPESLEPEETEPSLTERIASAIKSVQVAQAASSERPEVVKEVVPFGQEAVKALSDDRSLNGPTLEPAPEVKRGPQGKPASAAVIVETRPSDQRSRAGRTKENRSSVMETTPWRDATEQPKASSGRAGEETRVTRKSPRDSHPRSNAGSGKKRHETRVAKRKRGAVWSVQINSFATADSARDRVKKLQRSGYDAYMVEGKVKGRTWYRVRIGRFDSSKTAKQALATLKQKKDFRQAYLVKEKK